MNAGWRLCRLVLLSLPFLAVPSALLAQVDRGSIVGIVTDPAGARVSGAQVTVTNLAANQSASVTTDTNGEYTANLLRIGVYSVTVEKPGFQRAVQSSVDVGVNQTVRVDIALQIGSATESVQVTAAPPLLETESSSLGTIETERRISELPLNGRNFIQLAYLGPGANGGQTGDSGISYRRKSCPQFDKCFRMRVQTPVQGKFRGADWICRDPCIPPLEP